MIRIEIKFPSRYYNQYFKQSERLINLYPSKYLELCNEIEDHITAFRMLCDYHLMKVYGFEGN